MRERSVWILIGLITLALAGLIGLGAGGLMVLVVAPLMVLGIAGVAGLISRPADVNWLSTVVVLGFVAKLIGASVRYHFVRNVYASGDAFGYYRVGMEFANQWRAGNPPPLSGNRGFGTQVMEAIAGVVFVPFMPDFLGAFLLFATLSFFGQLFLYTAFRRGAKPHQLKPFALLILFLPSYVFWPSSPGKDAVMLLGLGIAVYCLTRCMEAYEGRWLMGAAIAVAGIGYIRVHISALFIGALLLCTVVAKPQVRSPGMAMRRLGVIAVIVLAGAVTATGFQARYGADLFNLEDIASFSEEVSDRTSGGGSAIPSEPVASPADVPKAIALVLFRPFLWEATGFEVRISALETSFLLGLFLWRLPAMLRNRKEWRTHSLAVFSTFYVLAFSIAFSAIRNLGIIARQRTQVLAFFLIVVITLGWKEPQTRKRRRTSPSSPIPSEQQQLVWVGGTDGVRRSE